MLFHSSGCDAHNIDNNLESRSDRSMGYSQASDVVYKFIDRNTCKENVVHYKSTQITPSLLRKLNSTIMIARSRHLVLKAR
jgi:hypothetical protein